MKYTIEISVGPSLVKKAAEFNSWFLLTKRSFIKQEQVSNRYISFRFLKTKITMKNIIIIKNMKNRTIIYCFSANNDIK